MSTCRRSRVKDQRIVEADHHHQQQQRHLPFDGCSRRNHCNKTTEPIDGKQRRRRAQDSLAGVAGDNVRRRCARGWPEVSRAGGAERPWWCHRSCSKFLRQSSYLVIKRAVSYNTGTMVDDEVSSRKMMSLEKESQNDYFEEETSLPSA